MPEKPASICRNPQCHRKTYNTYCTVCQDKGLGKKKYGFSSELHPWYNNKVWKGNPNKRPGQRGGIRESKLLETPYCRLCKEEDGIINDVSKGGIVDHIIPWQSVETESEKWSLFTDFDNLQVLCHKHHSSKSAQDKKHY